MEGHVQTIKPKSISLKLRTHRSIRFYKNPAQHRTDHFSSSLANSYPARQISQILTMKFVVIITLVIAAVFAAEGPDNCYKSCSGNSLISHFL